MFLRILTASIALLFVTVSCSVFPEPESASEQEKTQPVIPDRGRTAESWYFPNYDLSRAFAYFHFGKEVLQLCSYQLGPGMQRTGPWWLWTVDDQAKMTIIPPQPVLKKDVELRIPHLDFSFRGKQQKIRAEFQINGETLLKQEFTPKSPKSLSLKIPARLNQSGRMPLTIRFTGLCRQSELGVKNDPRKLGIGFRFVNDDLVASNRKISRAFFQIEQITPPGPDGAQKAKLCLLGQIYGLALPENLDIDLYPAGIDPHDPVKRYLPGDRLELILENRPGRPHVVLFGGPVSWTPDPLSRIPGMCGPVKNPPLPESVKQEQKIQISKDLPVIRKKQKNRMRDLAAEERFQRLWIQAQKKYQTIPAVFSPDNGQEIERFQNQLIWAARQGSFFSLPKKFVFMEKSRVFHNISALLAIRDRLRNNQIQLIILLVPDAGQIAARAMVPRFDHSGSLSAIQCTASLLEFGLEAAYTDDIVMSRISQAERLFCYPDPRPEAALWKILADVAADRLGRFGMNHFKESEPVHFAERRGPTAFGNKYRWPVGVSCGDHKNGEVVESIQVFRNGVPFKPDPKSAILVVGGENINLPGPGHTFTGLLSKNLQYSVDELCLPGEGWIQNLPAVLSGQPRRYLDGKKVVFLMLSPRILAQYTLPDLNQLESQELRLKKQKPVHQFQVNYRNDNIVPPALKNGERNFRQKAIAYNSWIFSSVRTQVACIRIKNTAALQDFVSLTIPDKLKSKPMTLVLSLATFPGQNNILNVNGKDVLLPINSDRAYFRNIAVPLEPGTGKAVLKFSGTQDNLLMIRDIILYQ